MLAAVFLFLLPPPASCQPIHSDTIRGADLAVAAPQFAGVPADAAIGLAPLPGQHRTLSIPELRRIAAAYHLGVEPEAGVCFAWDLKPLERQAIQAAMEKALDGRHPHIEIVEQSLAPVPDGDVVFPLTNWAGSASGPSLWRGYVAYGSGRQFPVWARVSITVSETRIVAVGDLRAGETLDAKQVKAESFSGALSRQKFITDGSDAVGLLLRRPVSAGTPLSADMLEAAPEVERGDLVNAIVQNGGARLDVQAVAQDGGHHGQIITVKNPRSGRTFRARVEAKDVVVVVPGSSTGLVGTEPAKL